jgi:hypothetical protein
MTRPGLVAANNLSDVANRGKAWDNLGFNMSADLGPLDIDAENYIQAVAAADGENTEPFVQLAINSFVTGCKSDGIWTAIKACCILSGAKTLAGALVPLVGAAPTNFNFVSADYDRKTGLIRNGGDKYLDSNRNNNADPQNNNHNAVWVSTTHNVSGSMFMGAGAATSGANNLASDFVRNRGGTFLFGFFVSPGLVGMSRSASNVLALRRNNANASSSVGSNPASSDSVWLYRRNGGGAVNSSARLSFYSIGESLDLALLDARVTALVNAFAVTIP